MSVRLDTSEVIGILEQLEYEHPELSEAWIRARMAVHELAGTKAVSLSEWAERDATTHERRHQALFEELYPDATDDDYPEK